MSKWTLLISAFLFSLNVCGQIPVEQGISLPIKAATVVSTDNFGNIYYIDQNQAFHKRSQQTDINFSNVALGRIKSANAFNPLKINLFYQDFNTIILLDNRLADVYRIDLNELKPYRNISHISTGYDSTLWFFNQDLNRLELYDYNTRKTRVQTLPVASAVLDLQSDYNYAWLLTENFLYKYNYQGSLVEKYPNDGYISIFPHNENVLLFNGNAITYLDGKLREQSLVELPQLLIKQFLLTNETLYIYDGELLHQFQLKIK